MIKPIPEHILIEGFKKGEEKALTHFYKLHFRQLCYFAERLTGNRQEAEDVVAEKFLTLFRMRENFESAGNIKAFLYISVRNACMNHLKLMKRQAAAQKEVLYLSSEGNEEDTFSWEVESKVLQHVYEEIENLPRRCKEVFKKIFFDGLSTKEIAEQLKISPNTVLNQKARAYKLLRVVLLKKNMLEVLAFWSVMAFFWELVKFPRFLYHNLFLVFF